MYINTLISLQENIPTYGVEGKAVTGHMTIATPGIIKCYVQNLKRKSNRSFEVYVFSSKKDTGVKLGALSEEKETKWRVDENSVMGSSIGIADIDGVAIIVEEEEFRSADAILIGFKNNRFSILPLLDKLICKKPNKEQPIEEPGPVIISDKKTDCKSENYKKEEKLVDYKPDDCKKVDNKVDYKPDDCKEVDNKVDYKLDDCKEADNKVDYKPDDCKEVDYEADVYSGEEDTTMNNKSKEKVEDSCSSCMGNKREEDIIQESEVVIDFTHSKDVVLEDNEEFTTQNNVADIVEKMKQSKIAIERIVNKIVEDQEEDQSTTSVVSQFWNLNANTPEELNEEDSPIRLEESKEEIDYLEEIERKLKSIQGRLKNVEEQNKVSIDMDQLENTESVEAIKISEQQKVINEIYTQGQVVEAFIQEGTDTEWVKISYSELLKIPGLKREWCTQPFITFAVYKYNEILLGKDGLDKYYLGIPDVYHPERKDILKNPVEVQGFLCRKNIAPVIGEYGYWIIPL